MCGCAHTCACTQSKPINLHHPVFSCGEKNNGPYTSSHTEGKCSLPHSLTDTVSALKKNMSANHCTCHDASTSPGLLRNIQIHFKVKLNSKIRNVGCDAMYYNRRLPTFQTNLLPPFLVEDHCHKKLKSQILTHSCPKNVTPSPLLIIHFTRNNKMVKK